VTLRGQIGSLVSFACDCNLTAYFLQRQKNSAGMEGAGPDEEEEEGAQCTPASTEDHGTLVGRVLPALTRAQGRAGSHGLGQPCRAGLLHVALAQMGTETVTLAVRLAEIGALRWLT
jgi:hypothetical protein